MNPILTPLSFQIVRPTRNAAARTRVQNFITRWRQRWGQAATQRLLRDLDDVELRDIGLTRADIESFAAERHRSTDVTRMLASDFATAVKAA